MLFVEFGSIVDGVDGELARLRFQFSRTGQWLDTMVDDVANCAYVSGVMVSLAMSGATWAVPLGVAALAAFAMTQLAQYTLIRFVYRSGDLAAIPWAYQSAAALSRTGWRALLPKLLKRDFVISVFVVFAALGHLDWILVAFATGAFAFFAVFFVQLARNWRTLALPGG
jgi:CDP-L-myo-inositol myo-inositolphosphotransferase